METSFLGVPDVSMLTFAALTLAPVGTAALGIVTGSAGGLLLLSLLSLVFPPAVLIPVHTVVQMGAGATRVAIMWSWVMRWTVLPFLVGSVLGAALGAQVFVSLSTATLQAILGGFIIVMTWMPGLTRMGGDRNRFAAIGFGATFLGMFVSATGTLIAPFVAGSSPDRRNHAATFAALMTIVHTAKLAAFGLLGVALHAYLPLMLAMIASATLGNWIGSRLLSRMPEKGFRVVFQVVVTALALRLLWRAARDSGLF
ncbi:MAG: TSUP family transporter [Alphaproteobacteria bacterium]|nr:TSUP family transporter [Alphaproteobacteria bacterium]